ncbi:hypothetical protein GCM10027347_02750 [Larkinella harenae]
MAPASAANFDITVKIVVPTHGSLDGKALGPDTVILQTDYSDLSIESIESIRKVGFK